MDPGDSAQPAPSTSIHSLPVEILADIFVVGTHDLVEFTPGWQHDDKCQLFDTHSAKTPLVYSRVSRHWRSVALSTPALYTSLCITPELLREVGSSEVLDMTGISSYLTLSQNHLLDISIDARDQNWDFENERCFSAWFSADHMNAAMTVLLPFIGRWRSLSILTDVYPPMRIALDLLEQYIAADGAPNLECLRLMRCAYNADFFSLNGPPVYRFLSFPSVINDRTKLTNLRHLTLRGISAEWNSLAGLLPEELDMLELSIQPIPTQPSIPDLARILRAVPNLERLVLNGAGPVLPEPGSAAPPGDGENVHLPQLKALKLGYTSAAAAVAVLQLLKVPHLNTLALEDANPVAMQMPAVDALPVLTALFAPPVFPTLANLTLRRVHLSSRTPLVRVERLELAEMALGPLAFECTDTLCVQGTGGDPASMEQTKAALSAFIRDQGATAPRVVELYENQYGVHYGSRRRGDVEEFSVANTQVRVFHHPGEVSYDDEDIGV
ncbi:hypothetical protein C8R46DRAFT_890100 [Mycena filopes]|nr:hypothetical protein C8R46DRAFT_890100 [Mycena filopes]